MEFPNDGAAIKYAHETARDFAGDFVKVGAVIDAQHIELMRAGKLVATVYLRNADALILGPSSARCSCASSKPSVNNMAAAAQRFLYRRLDSAHPASLPRPKHFGRDYIGHFRNPIVGGRWDWEFRNALSFQVEVERNTLGDDPTVCLQSPAQVADRHRRGRLPDGRDYPQE
jgi:hypothetical protein